jgi:hypothetical protein
MILDPTGSGFIQAGGISIGNNDIRAEVIEATDHIKADYLNATEEGVYYPTAASIGSDPNYAFSFGWDDGNNRLIVYLWNGSSYTPKYFTQDGSGSPASVSPSVTPTVTPTTVETAVNPAVDPDPGGGGGGGGDEGPTCDCSVYNAYCNSIEPGSIPACDPDCGLVGCLI